MPDAGDGAEGFSGAAIAPNAQAYALERLGFVQVRQRGSHAILKMETLEGGVGCVVPLHRELAVATLRGLLKQAKVDPDEFIRRRDARPAGLPLPRLPATTQFSPSYHSPFDSPDHRWYNGAV